MATHVALLRGINVGGNNKVAMSDLRAITAGLGHADVSTYIQSGNVLFTTSRSDSAALAAELEEAITAALPVRPRVVVVSRGELARVIGDNPYPDPPNPKLLHAVFRGTDPGPDLIAAVAAAVQQSSEAGSRDSAQFVGKVLYLHTPDGYGRSDLAARLAKAKGPLSAREAGTARNWTTVCKLLALCDG